MEDVIQLQLLLQGIEVPQEQERMLQILANQRCLKYSKIRSTKHFYQAISKNWPRLQVKNTYFLAKVYFTSKFRFSRKAIMNINNNHI